MGTGMGIPSASIYAKELITEYGVKNLIRVGTCGGIGNEIRVREVIIAMGASTDSGVNRSRFDGLDFSATADYHLMRAAIDAAEALEQPVRVGNVFSTDLFYHPDAGRFEMLGRMGILAVEMEAAGLYGVAAEYGARAMAIMTVSDQVTTGEATTSDERQTSFAAMMEIALEAAISI
jgi:purine-nucleoside phosphorylase